MAIRKKIAAVFVCVLTVFSMTFAAFAAENSNGYTEQDGVIFETITDKDTYISGDKAKFTIKVTNTNDYDISNLSVVYTVPANFDIQTADMPKTIDVVKAGETTTLEFETVVTSDTEEPSDGNNMIIIIIAIAAVVVVAVVVIVIIIKKKKKPAALMLVGALLAGSVASVMSSPIDVNAEVNNSDYRRVSVHDPSVVKDPKTGKYYIFGSHMAWAKSDDLIAWTSFKNNINTDYNKLFGDVWNNYCKTNGANLNGNLWAPDVIYNEKMGKWCMYMSVNGANWQSAIVLLTADNIEGPYEYAGGVVYSGFFDYAKFGDESSKATLNEARAKYSDVYKVLGEGADLTRYSKTAKSLVNCIDPNVEYDRDGNLWMTYGSWSGGIYQIKLDTATGLRDYGYKYEDVLNKSDAYLGYKIAGGYYNSGEGPYILKTDDYYYLFISIGNLETSGGYNMRVYRSESINGPYVDEAGKSSILTGWSNTLGFSKAANKYTSPLGIKLMGAYSMYGTSLQIQAAQGHNSAFVDDDGRMYVVYHTRFAGTGEGHEVRVHQLIQTETGWLTAAPYEYSGEKLAETMSADDVTGTYEFLIQKKNVVYNNALTPNEGESFWTNTYKKIKVNSEDVTLSMRFSWKEGSAKVADSQGVVYAIDKLTLNADGTISGDKTGTWKLTNGANVSMTIDGKEYSGAFIEQQNELSTRDVTMTFTLVGDNQCAWGTRNPADN